MTTKSRPLTLQDCCDGTLQVGPSGDSDGFSLITELLADQHELSAVDVFSRVHESGELPDQARYYSRLLPASRPGPGQQYAFEVDLDRCSGCKACVAGCHALNGLDEKETWRDVGLLIGGTPLLPVMQHVTTACHHCIEPACLSACPVDAYEKDSVTGIVRHLDDQCFGCQYCTLACPYDVPKYHKKKGIVRKCDMCSNRLSQGEAPACVQACPHEAIAIRVVDIAVVKENAEADNFLPAAPEPHLTLPTTTYKTKRVFPRNMLPADYYSISPQHPHWPLIIMLVLTQLSVGAFATICFLESSLDAALSTVLRPYQATAAFLLGQLALAASTCHLGRPLYAFRGIIGLRHSWLSREILVFGMFAGLSFPFAVLCWVVSIPGLNLGVWHERLVAMISPLGLAVTAVGGLGVFCSAMIYVFTKRELWNFERTILRFALTSIVMGLATSWLSLVIMQHFSEPTVAARVSEQLAEPLARMLMAAMACKLLFDATILRHLLDFRNAPLKRSALLIVGPLRRISFSRVVAGVVGGILIPAVVLQQLSHGPAWTASPGGELSILTMWLACLSGELLERYLFFAAVSSPRMPGGVRQ
ncbi:DmsC/YnfH family molybdoenzyme membrane anchor subunit [Planctomicrobium piriforme]|nr:DmsC/YnfH family molybdoenzyme membrane anchor subunit [Planctomicrobium piriforme]